MSTTPAPSPTRDDDLTLRARCIARPAERAAWDELYRRFAPTVRARVSFGRRAFPARDVDDIVQTVFLKLAAGALERYEGRCSLKSYLLTLADSVRISENRRRTATKRGSGQVLSFGELPPDSLTASPSEYGGQLPNLTQTSPDPEAVFLAGRRQDRVRLAVSRLADPRDREIVALYFADEPCVDREIAARLNMPLNTVTWRRLKAMKELRRHLNDLEGRPG